MSQAIVPTSMLEAYVASVPQNNVVVKSVVSKSTQGQLQGLSSVSGTDAHLQEIIALNDITVISEKIDAKFEIMFITNCPFGSNSHDGKGSIGKVKNGGYFAKCLSGSCSKKGWSDLVRPDNAALQYDHYKLPDAANYSWGTPVSLSVQYTVPEMPDQLIPESIFEYCNLECQNTSAPREFLVISLIITMASLIGRKVRIQPKVYDNWNVVPNVYGLIIGGPGAKKSPMLSKAVGQLDILRNNAEVKYKQDLSEYDVENVKFDLAADDAKAKHKNALKSDENIDETTDNLEEVLLNNPVKPTLKRYSYSDATIEKAGELLMGNSNGLLLEMDEISSLFNSLSKNNRECDRAFYLTAAGGNQDYCVDRIGRDSIYIKGLCLSIIGGIQPEVLHKFIDKSSRDTGEDGLVPRFQLMVYPEPKSYQKVDIAIDVEITDRIENIIKRLDEDYQLPLNEELNDSRQSRGDYELLHFEEDAQEVFFDWLEL